MAWAKQSSPSDATPLPIVASVVNIVDPPASMAPPSADALGILGCYIDGRDHPLRRLNQEWARSRTSAVPLAIRLPLRIAHVRVILRLLAQHRGGRVSGGWSSWA